MAEEEKRSESASKAHRPTTPVDPVQAFTKAYETYAQALGRSAETTWKWASDTRRRYEEEFKKLHDDAQAQAVEAYMTFVKRANEPPGAAAAPDRFQAAQQDYARTLYKIDEDLRQRVTQLHQRYGDTSQVETVARTWRDEVAAAWRAYLHELQRLWHAVDAASLDPATLTRIAQSLTAAAQLNSTLPTTTTTTTARR